MERFVALSAALYKDFHYSLNADFLASDPPGSQTTNPKAMPQSFLLGTQSPGHFQGPMAPRSLQQPEPQHRAQDEVRRPGVHMHVHILFQRL